MHKKLLGKAMLIKIISLPNYSISLPYYSRKGKLHNLILANDTPQIMLSSVYTYTRIYCILEPWSSWS